nr:hypothetical protein B0A51_10043 [Rachicladosporium sp. CCFEE 5018]
MSGPGEAVQAVTDKVKEVTMQDADKPKLLLDEVTGEQVSKSELKKRQKQREKAAEKAEKEAARAPPAASNPKKRSAEEDEGKLEPHQYFEMRSRAVKRMKDTQSPNPYPHKFSITYDLTRLVEDYGHLKKGELAEDKPVAIMARVYNIRESGENLRFYQVGYDGFKCQVMAQSQKSTSIVPFADQHSIIRRGDWIGVKGFPGRTSPKAADNPGELSIFCQDLQLLAPCLRQIPSEHYGFKDAEERHRKRYLDIMINERSMKTLIVADEIDWYIRNYFRSNGFRHMNTPILNKNAGGATARPFETHHNDLNMTLSLRIATELPLKMLIVGGFPKVYEIGRIFRNEGADLTHNPEFTSCEYYEAGADVNDVMDRTEELVEGMVQKVCGSLNTEFHTQHDEVYQVNWAKPWKRIEMIPALEEACGEKFPPGETMHTEEFNDFLKRMLKKTNVECTPPLTNARMLDKLVGEFIEEKCINPTFITGHPQMMSPLAKYHRSEKGLCERFEAFVCKKEIVNAYSELNDPFDQRLRFEEQARQKGQGDDEAQTLDEPFLEAMEYGLPPTGGWGMGIDRMVMFLADHYSIKEVLTFPFMKDVVDNKDKVRAAEIVDVEPMEAQGVGHK